MLHNTHPLQRAPRRIAAAAPAFAGHRPLAIAMAVAACFSVDASAQPAGAQAVHGSATLIQNGSRLTVTTQNGAGSSHSAINWKSFGVPAGTTTWFAQPGSTSTSINRVTGPDPSAIFGTLGSNGRLVLVNPSGITVGVGAVVDTAGFTASTLRMSDADAMAGRLRFRADGSVGALDVQGAVLARGGDIVLIGPKLVVGKAAVVESRGGATILAAGQSVEITGRGLEGIRLEVQAPGDQAINLGTLTGDAVGIFAGTLKHSGVIRAQTATLEGGRIVLKALKDVEIAPAARVLADGGAGQPGGSISIASAAGNVSIGNAAIVSANGGEGATGGAIHIAAATGTVHVAGSLTASSPAQTAAMADASGTGGQVQVLGQKVHLDTGASVDVSGDAGGGTILVGGDLQGKNPDVMNAQDTTVAAGVVLAADARVRGDGGKVIVWADNDTHFAGHLSARGGENGGDGGSGETSGKHLLYFRGTADLSARRGRQGSLLLDPANITVGTVANINGDGTNGDDILLPTDLGSASASFPGANSLITASALTTLLNAADVTLAATNSITVNSAIGKTGVIPSTLTLDASTVSINNSIGSSGAPLNLNINASGSATLSAVYQGGTLISGGPLFFNAATLDGVTIGSSLTAGNGGYFFVRNGLTLGSGVNFNIGNNTLYMAGASQSINASGPVTLTRAGGGIYGDYNGLGSTLTLGTGLTVTGYGSISNGPVINNGTVEATASSSYIQTTSFTNNGTLRTAGGDIYLNPTSFTNASTGALVNNGGTLTIAAVNALTNSGAITLNAGTTNFGGSFTPAALATGYSRATGSIVNLSGTLALGGGTLDIGGAGLFGPGGLSSKSGGTLLSGTVISGDGTALNSYNSTLDGVTIGSSLTAGNGGYFFVRNGLTLGSGVNFNIGNNTLYM
ncbi:MAG: filamentous hemagglutinin N-terminal domain-containing protein, partial [Ramlibacter sp.]|nr:filamentous hemagglutinin N-terminal domain-containing protein [Ramlibacter sp.]